MFNLYKDMRVYIGSLNPSKIAAVADKLKDYSEFKLAEITGVAVSSEVSEQPLGIEETVRGARNRAKAARDLGAAYGIGLESGLIPVPYTKTGYMDVTVCAIYDGKDYHLGLSSSFEYPKKLTRLVLEENLDISTAAKNMGLTAKEKVGTEEGMIGILTKGRLPRKDYSGQAVTMALIHLENPELY